MKSQFNPNALNMYTCQECGSHIITRDLHEGITPFIIRCAATHACTGRMESAMYRVFDPNGRLKPTHEWYRPVIIDPFWSPSVRAHIDKGGLLLRIIATHHHVKRGTPYNLLHGALLQTSGPLTDGQLVYVYRDKDLYFVRSAEEFDDGRFAAVE